MALMQAWTARLAARRHKEALSRARGLAGTPVAARPGAGTDEFSAPEGAFGRLDIARLEARGEAPLEAPSLPA